MKQQTARALIRLRSLIAQLLIMSSDTLYLVSEARSDSKLSRSLGHLFWFSRSFSWRSKTNISIFCPVNVAQQAKG